MLRRSTHFPFSRFLSFYFVQVESFTGASQARWDDAQCTDERAEIDQTYFTISDFPISFNSIPFDPMLSVDGELWFVTRETCVNASQPNTLRWHFNNFILTCACVCAVWHSLTFTIPHSTVPTVWPFVKWKCQNNVNVKDGNWINLVCIFM